MPKFGLKEFLLTISKKNIEKSEFKSYSFVILDSLKYLADPA
jgi:hypothetical protein